MTRARILLVFVAASAGLGAVGCSTTTTAPDGNGEMASSEMSGDVVILLEASLDEAYNAALGAISDLQFRVESERKDALVGVIAAWTAEQKRVRVRLEPRGEGTTRVRANSGPFYTGIAKRVLDRTRARLLESSAPPKPSRDIAPPGRTLP